MKIPYETWEEELEDEEFQGPWDGVLPVDYPTTYQTLLNIYCSKIVCQGVYVSNWGRICSDCYNRLAPNIIQDYHPGGWHDMCSYQTTIRISICANCRLRISAIQPAAQCPECIEQYFDLSTEELWNVQAEAVLEVITRW